MNKKALFHPTVKCGQFAFLVVLTNWHYGRSYKVKDVAYAWQIDGTLFTSFLALVGLIYFGAKIRRYAKQQPDFVWDIKRMFRLVDWSPCLILVPLLFSITFFAESNTDGVETVIRYGYGSANPLAAFLVISAAMAAYQLSKRPAKLVSISPHGHGGIATSS